LTGQNLSLEVLSAETNDDEFGDLDALLEEETIFTNTSQQEDEFFELDELLDLDTLEPVTQAVLTGQNLSLEVLSAETNDDEFGDLDALLEEETIFTNTSQQEVDSEYSEYTLLDLAPPTPSTVIPATSSGSIKQSQAQTAATKPRRVALEQMMKVPIKQLDNVSNLVGELVVNRNSLEQDQQRMRQSLDNLLHQVQQLNGLGSRMQDLYERSLMEASLINIRQGSWSASPDKSATSSVQHATGMDFDALEMDRFTGFHTLSQEMIELIVRVREASSDIEFVTDDTEQVARQFRQVTTQLQEGLTRSRMVPFSEIAERLPRAVRDISLKYGKQVELLIEGQETLIDKMLLQQLYDPMTHLVNNSITHGIETPKERATKGKPPVGKVTIRAFYQGNQTVIAVSDDGAGIDTDVVMTKAIQKGLITVAQARTMSRLDTYNLLFHPGFSTKDQADEYAGRGVGMDVVQTSLNEIRGTISTDSTLGKGTTFTIRLPLTLSICKALCCLSDKAQIAFPMDGVEDTIDISPNKVITNEEGQSCISWRDSLLPFRPLKELLTCNRQIGRGNLYGGKREDDMISIVVLRSAGTFIVVQVDQVLGEQEIVIKQFEGPAPKPVGVAGATVMGDGRVMPIADVLELIDLSTGRLQREGGADLLWTSIAAPVLTTPDVKTEPMVLIVDDSITVRELLSLTFNKAGYRVEQARDGQEAWDKLRDGLPCDLVFCDIEMPRMDGLELLSRMQKDPNLSQLPMAMLTSRGADRHRQMAIQLGARGYFTKPYVEESLLDGAQRMLNGEVLVAASIV
jgi:chemosensory pili system protein ChpA (sensor histidine kinase/response regulator)